MGTENETEFGEAWRFSGEIEVVDCFRSAEVSSSYSNLILCAFNSQYLLLFLSSSQLLLYLIKL